MKNLQLDYENQYQVRNYILNEVLPSINKSILNDYIDVDKYDALHEIIDGLSDVIYNYQAKKVCEAFDLDPFGVSEITGEQFNSFNVMCYECILNEYQNKYQ